MNTLWKGDRTEEHRGRRDHSLVVVLATVCCVSISCETFCFLTRSSTS